jgi:hypothetical protein
MLEVVPAAFKCCRVDGTSMLMSTQNPGALDAQDVHEVALGSVEEERAESDIGCLGDLGFGQHLFPGTRLSTSCDIPRAAHRNPLYSRSWGR